ncbi:MAG: DUF6340 family protein [Bacteroidales bacterium]
MRTLSIVLLTGLLVAGCSRYGYVSLNFPVEPAAYLPEGTERIAAVNRSLTNEESEDRRVSEAIGSAEIAGSDKLASDEAIKGVYDQIRELPGTELVIPRQAHLTGTGTRQVPELIPWEEVRAICEQEGADALLVLEMFDSNSDLLRTAATEQVASVLSTGRLSPGVPGHVNVNVACYWRLYDPEEETIIDHFQFNQDMGFDTRAGILPPNALPEAGYAAGRTYISRFLPSYYTVRRQLYKRTGGSAKRQFKAGYRRTEVANWQGSMEIWEELANHPKAKTAGRACLNLAVSYEVLGNTPEALVWAQKSYEFYDDKVGRDYAKILLARKRIEGF